MSKKVLLRGPLLTRSGYGEQARFALRSLRSREDLFEIYIQPIQWGQTSWISEADEERQFIDQTIEKTIGYLQQGGQFDLSIQVTIPNEWEKLAPINIGYTAGMETTKVAPQWLEKGNMMDKIIVVSSHSKQIYENTEYSAQTPDGTPVTMKLQTPIEYVNYPVKTFDNLPELDLEIDYDFNFLCVAQFGPRKNLSNTIQWFVEEFHDDEVGLVVKSNIARNCLLDRKKLHFDLKNFLSDYPDRKCKIYLLHGDMTDEEMHSLYKHPLIKAFVVLSHGEGFGLPIFEAAYTGLPVVTPGWSGQLDFLVDKKGKEHFYNVAFDLNPVQENAVWEGVIVADSMWAFPREQSAKEQMRLCYNDAGPRPKENQYALHLQDTFSKEGKYSEFVSQLEYFIVDENDDFSFFERENAK
jgi:hypothetical protein